MAKRKATRSELEAIFRDAQMVLQNGRLFLLCNDAILALVALYARRPDEAIKRLESALIEIVEEGKRELYPQVHSLAAILVDFIKTTPSSETRFLRFRDAFFEPDKVAKRETKTARSKAKRKISRQGAVQKVKGRTSGRKRR